MYDYRTVYTPAVLPPKPTPRAPVGFTMEQLMADARRANERQKKEWGNHVAVKVEPLSKAGRTFWTADRDEALEADITDMLRRHGPQSAAELLARLTAYCNRHKLRALLTDMRKAGKVAKKQVGSKRQEWRLA